MSAAHALDLPEILSLVARHASRSTLLACLRVSRNWHRTFVRFIWSHITLHPPDPPLYALRAHSHLVKALDILCSPTRPHLALAFPNLAELSIRETYSSDGTDIMELVLNHPSLTHLTVWNISRGQPSPFWNRLATFRHLTDLSMPLDIHDDHVDEFWQLCTRLKRLDIRRQGITGQGSLASMTFPRLLELTITLSQGCNVPLTLEFMQKCPSLTSMTWSANQFINTEFIPGLKPLCTARTWPNLRSLCVRPFRTRGHDNDILDIIESMPQIIAISIVHLSFDSRAMRLMQLHYYGIQKLVFTHPIGFTSATAQEIMCQCPMLETFVAPSITAKDIIEGHPWVCLNLRVLSLKFCFHPQTVRRMQPLVFERLSKLTRLEELTLGGSLSEDAGQKLYDVCNLTLENGLDRLSTLRSLRVLDIITSRQGMCEKEIEWVMEHWVSLTDIYGVLNVNTELKRRLWDQGIAFHGY